MLRAIAWLAAAAAVAQGALQTFVIAKLADDDHAQATTMLIDPVTGKSTFNGPTFAFAGTDQSSLFCFLGWNAANETYIASSGATPDVVVVKAATSSVLSSVPFASEGDFILSWAWDDLANSLLVTILTTAAAGTGEGSMSSSGRSSAPSVRLAYVNVSSGVQTPLGAPLPPSVVGHGLLPCEAILYPARHWMVLAAPTGDRDDASDSWVVVDYSLSPPAVVFTDAGAWSHAEYGTVNAYTFLPPSSPSPSPSASAQALTTAPFAWPGILAWGKKDDGASGPSLYAVDIAPGGPGNGPGNGTVHLLHAWGGEYKETVITLGCATVQTVTPGAAWVLYTLARDMGSEQQQLFIVHLGVNSTAGGASPPVMVLNATVLAVQEPPIGGDVYGLQWIDSA